MSLSRKYGRTYHFPFSPGTTSDDRFNHHYWNDLQSISTVVHTEKMDGERSSIKNDLGDLEIFGENIYAIHSIQYQKIEHHFYVFAVRLLEQWLSWEEVKFYAGMLDFPTVPELQFSEASSQEHFEKQVMELAAGTSCFESIDVSRFAQWKALSVEIQPSIQWPNLNKTSSSTSEKIT